MNIREEILEALYETIGSTDGGSVEGLDEAVSAIVTIFMEHFRTPVAGGGISGDDQCQG